MCVTSLLSPQDGESEGETRTPSSVLAAFRAVGKMIIWGAESLTFVIICLRHLN